ncbi:extracellular dioxygenase [Phyllosticta citribraziliensis]|uniref:Extracellular dioxygenase n=1 Tax=Phyllosticta citribraziliensis TaxID=989973 RepID=A0ABR1M516_9PEZI
MVNIKTLGAAALSLLAATEVVAHPGHDIKAEAMERRAALSSFERRSLSHCQDKLKARGVHDKNIARRHNMAQQLRKRHLVERDLATYANTSHASNLTGITPETDPSVLFAGNNSCILGPETTQGPYYVSQELFRSNITEDQLGVPLYLDVQVVDTETCEPLEGVAMDFWHCNATGVYSGVTASGNGESTDESNLNKTFLRGIQASDKDGVMQFISIVPGHYTSRATHIHLLAHSAGNWSLLENGTISGGTSTSHVAQIFFDQDLLETVESTAPYNTNTQEWTQNSEDSIAEQEAADDMDPFVEYVVLDENDITAGVFSWITIGMNSSATYSVSPAAVYAPGGGYMTNSNGGMGGGNSSAPPSS